MYVDDRLGRRSRAHSGLDQLTTYSRRDAAGGGARARAPQSAKAKTPQTAGRRPIFSRATASHAL